MHLHHLFFAFNFYNLHFQKLSFSLTLETNKLFTKEKKKEKRRDIGNMIKKSYGASHFKLKNVSDIYKSEYREKLGGKLKFGIVININI